jgi:hypothetical protein
MAYVYRHIRLDKNQPFYIGIGSDKQYQRARCKQKRNNIWNKIINKTDYRIDIVMDDLTWEEACEKESEFICLYGRININTGILCNLTDGGEGANGAVRSNDVKKHLSELRKGIIFSDETKKKISEAKKGFKHSEESIQKMRKPKSYETRRRMSESQKKLKQKSPEQNVRG